MPRDSGGTFSLVSGYLAVTGQNIEASQHNPPLEDIATALTGSLPRNGSAGMQANLAMAGFKVTGMADGTAADDAVTKSQLDGVASVASTINAATAKTPLVDDDRFAITDSAVSYAIKRVTWDAIKSTLKTYFDGLYASISTTITTTGLLTGGGTLAANRTFDVPIASEAEALAGTSNTVAMTPLRTMAVVEDAVPPSTAPSGSWVSIARTASTTYTNTFEKDIAFRTTGGGSGDITMQISPDGTEWITQITAAAGTNIAMKVPNGWKYRFTTSALGYSTSEYR
jgi:hypothetical protein